MKRIITVLGLAWAAKKILGDSDKAEAKKAPKQA